MKDSSTDDVGTKLKELLQWEKTIQTCPYKYDSTHAYLLQRIGVMYYKQSDYLRAVQYTRGAIDIIRANQKRRDINPRRVIDCYFNLMFYYDSLKLTGRKNQIVDSCVSLALQMNAVTESVIVAMESRAKYLFNIGDYQGCIKYASMGETVAYNNGLQDSRFTMGLFTWHIDALLFSKNYSQAEEALMKKKDEYLKSTNLQYAAVIYMLLAELAKEKKDFSKSLEYYQTAFRYVLQTGFAEGAAPVLNNIGFHVYFENLNLYDNALFYYRKALRYADPTESLNINANIANVCVRKKQFDSADIFFQKAFDQIKPGLNENDLLQHTQDYITENITEYVVALVLDKADAALARFKASSEKKILARAIEVYKTADLLLQQIKLTQYETLSKLFWQNHARRLYEHAIEACYLQNNVVDAFYFFEKSRAVLLQDQLNEQHWAGEENIAKQTQFEKKIRQLEMELNSADGSNTQKSTRENELFSNRQELERLKEVIKTENPLYYQNFVDKNFITVKDVEGKILNEHQALIELFSGDSSAYVLIITQQQPYLKKIKKTDFDNLSDTYRNFISNPGLLNRNFDSFKSISLQLYQLIFQDVNLPTGRIVISPDGKYFPFEALVRNLHPLTYFLDDNAVSYTYSARYLLNQFKANAVPSSGEFIGVAPVHYSNGFPSLLGSDQSLKHVQNYFTAPVNLTGGNASKNNFLKKYYRYTIIQLYTHATENGYSGEPTIYFADSALLLSDLFYESRPATSLIVLSACETAQGKIYNGEGVFSFNRQFAALGIPSSISNLWQADDQATYKITEFFYKHLAQGMPLDVALQTAKKEFKSISSKQKNLPYYWAASILVGQTNPIQVEKRLPSTWIAIAVIILLFVLGGLKMIRRSRSKGSENTSLM